MGERGHFSFLKRSERGGKLVLIREGMSERAGRTFMCVCVGGGGVLTGRTIQ